MIDSIISEFDNEWQTTRRLLAGIPQEKLTWKPHPKSMSIGQLALHIVSLPVGLIGAISGSQFDLASVNFDSPQPSSTAELLSGWEQAKQTVLEELGKYDEKKASENWKLVFGDKQLAAMPRIAAIRNLILNHIYHHRGQLSVYLRLLDLPVPSVYGPTADENPLAG